MRKRFVYYLLAACLFTCGCSTDSKESLEKKSTSIMKEMAKTIDSITDDESAQKAIPKLETLQKEQEETKNQLAIYSNGGQEITSESGIRMYNCFMTELVPALDRLSKKEISSELHEKIANILASGGYGRAKAMTETQQKNPTDGKDNLD